MKEAGTYVAQSDSADTFLDTAEAHYKFWEHPNVLRVRNVEAVLENLAKQGKTIESFRIVCHASQDGWLSLPFIDGFSESFASGTEFFDVQRWRDKIANGTLFAERHHQELFVLALKDATLLPDLAAIGLGEKLPPRESAVGILARAILDGWGLINASIGGLKEATKVVLEEWIALRRSKFETKTSAPAVKRLVEGGSEFLTRVAWRPLKITESELRDGFVDKYLDDTGALRTTVRRSIDEAAGKGSFLPLLASVRKKITANTHIEIRGCNIGRNPTALDGIRAFFGAPGKVPSISAPDLYQFFYQIETYPIGKESADGEWLGPLPDKIPLRSDWDGTLADNYAKSKRLRRGEITRVTNEASLDELRARHRINDKNTTSIERFNRLNPGLTQLPGKGEVVTLLDPPASSPDDLSFDTFLAELLSGKAFVGPSYEVRAWMENTQRHTALAAWLVAQQHDPKGRSVAALAKHLKTKTKDRDGNEVERLQLAHTQLLSVDIKAPMRDPIFADDPRYASHLTHRCGSGTYFIARPEAQAAIVPVEREPAAALAFADGELLHELYGALAESSEDRSALERDLEIVALPARAPERLPQRGDVMIRVPLGEPGPPRAYLLTSRPWHSSSEASEAESAGSGWYAGTVELGTGNKSGIARRILDDDGRNPAHQVVFRPKPLMR